MWEDEAWGHPVEIHTHQARATKCIEDAVAFCIVADKRTVMRQEPGAELRNFRTMRPVDNHQIKAISQDWADDLSHLRTAIRVATQNMQGGVGWTVRFDAPKPGDIGFEGDHRCGSLCLPKRRLAGAELEHAHPNERLACQEMDARIRVPGKRCPILGERFVGECTARVAPSPCIPKRAEQGGDTCANPCA